MTQEFVERELTPAEVQERRIDLESLLDEQDALSGRVDEYKREIRETKVELERITDNVRVLRREIKYRVVREPRQTEMAFKPSALAATYLDNPLNGRGPTRHESIPDPERDETDPPEHPPTLNNLYPRATTHERLRGDLVVVFQNLKLGRVPSLDELRQWDTASGIFFAVSSWARIEWAHLNASEYPELKLPEREPMPEKLAELVAQKPKRARSKKT